MDAFELVAKRDTAALQRLLAEEPQRAADRNADGASLLAFAAYNRNTDAIELIRAALPGIDPYEAIILGDINAVKRALASGWDSNTRSPDGFTALALAAFFQWPDLVDLLLPLTRDINARANNPQQVAAIHAAAANGDLKTIAKLITAGADLNQPQQQGFTALHTAAFRGDNEVVELLLLFSADPNLLDDAGMTAADRAREKGHALLAERLERASVR